MSAVSEQLKIFRKRAGLSQQEVADFIEPSRSHYANMERGEKLVPVDCLTQLCKVLRLTPEERQAFRLLVAISHLPTEFQSDFSAFLARLDRAEAALQRIKSET